MKLQTSTAAVTLKHIITYLLVGIFCIIPCLVKAQVINTNSTIDSTKIYGVDTNKVKIVGIQITGNRKTKGYIILREVPFAVGDSLWPNQTAVIFKQASTQVYNTNLFTDVKTTAVNINSHNIIINIAVKEKWYIYPTPQFQLADRSYNEWIKTYNADFNRVIYGVKFAHYNFSGRRDQLRIFLLNGYTRNYAFSYNAPYSNPNLTEGFAVAASFSQNREVGYKINFNNKLLNYKEDNFIRNSFSVRGTYSKRNSFFKRTAISAVLNYLNVADTIVSSKLNPNYFGANRSNQVFPDFVYAVSYSNTDNINYPRKGLIYGYGVAKRGFGFSGGTNSLVFSGTYSKYIPHGKKWFSNITTAGVLKLPFKQAFINQRAIGQGDLSLRGLEVYFIDGVAAAATKYTLTKQVAAFNIKVPFKIKAIPYVPFKIFAKGYTDVGYSYNTKEFATRLSNKFLYTGGVGIDILTFYDIVIKLEYSFNQIGEKGLFLSTNGGF